MKSKRFSVAKTWIAAALLLTFAACARKTSSPATTYTPTPAYLPTDSAGRAAPGAGINYERERLVGRIDARMNELENQIDELEKQERDLKRQRRDLERKQKRLNRQAKDLKKYDATAEWEKRKQDVNKMLE